jgi:hypothetical protein
MYAFKNFDFLSELRTVNTATGATTLLGLIGTGAEQLGSASSQTLRDAPGCALAFVGAVTATYSAAPRRVTLTGRVSNPGPGAAQAVLAVRYTRQGGPAGALLYGPQTLPPTGAGGAPFTIQQPVPGTAPAGTYALTVELAHAATGEVCDTEATTVTVSAPRAGVVSDPDAPWVLAPNTGVAFGAAAPAEAAVTPIAASPNPFAGRTAITYVVEAPGAAHLAVYDVLGREVAVLVDGYVEAGTHRATFDARGLAPGTYVYRLTVGSGAQAGRLTLLR